MTLVRDALRLVPAYAPEALGPIELDLRDNVNLWGAPPRALAAMRAVGADGVARYPSVNGTRLTAALAATIGVNAEEVVVGCGSDDLIDAAFRTVAAPGERVAHMDPGFSMVPRFARINGLEPIGIPLRADGAADVDAMLATGARVIYLCSPNNPTGTVTPEEDVRRCIARAPGVVIVDEAYAEFAGMRDWRAEAPSMGRVLVLRTFSKAWGLAGIRVGYGVGDRTLVDAVVRSRGPYKVNALAELAASTALREDAEWMLRCAREAIANRERLDALVRGRRGVSPLASEGNFSCWRVEGRASAFAARFAAHGIGVRAFSGPFGELLRIGVAPWPQLERLRPVIDECWP